MTPTQALALPPGTRIYRSYLLIGDDEFDLSINTAVFEAAFTRLDGSTWIVHRNLEPNEDDATSPCDTPECDTRLYGLPIEDYPVFGPLRDYHLTEGDAIRAAREELARHVARAGEYGLRLAEQLEDMDHA